MSSPQQSDAIQARFRRTVPAALTVLGLLVTAGVGVAAVLSMLGALSGPQQALLRRLDVAVLVFFVADVVLRAAVAESRLAALGARWFDFLVVAALLHAAAGERVAWSWFLVRQGVWLAVAAAGGRVAGRLLRGLRLRPARLMVASFAGAAALGAVLLALPIASASGRSIGLVDSLFTATSAVCVTGLIVKNTGSDFTLFGQLVILTLIQLGGLGIMTFSVSMLLMLGRRLSTSRQGVMLEMLDQESAREVTRLLRFIALSTFVIEAVGAAVLFVSLGAREGYTVPTVYSALFHSISAFCNAGFSLYGRSFEAYRGDVWVNLILGSLIIVGGLGFPVLQDLLVVGRRRRLGEGRSPGFRTQTKIVLAMSAALIAIGAVFFYAVERPCTLEGAPAGERVLASCFQSVTARTAGFNTVDIASVGQPALVVLMCLMFIGASPGSTGGGIKTTTAAILLQAARSAIRRRREVELFHRTVPRETIRRAMALVTFSVLLLAVASVALMSVEDQPFERLLFEEVSAFGTVGLSAGATPHLTVPGRLIITLLMFVGRVGPLSLTISLLGELRPARYAYPKTRIMVG